MEKSTPDGRGGVPSEFTARDGSRQVVIKITPRMYAI